jgi:methyl-accepting chemotaxis protein
MNEAALALGVCTARAMLGTRYMLSANVTLRVKILGTLAVALAIAMVIGAAGYLGASGIARRLEDVASAKFPALRVLAEMDAANGDAMRGINGLMIYEAPAEVRRETFARAEDAFRRLDEARKLYETLGRSEAAVAAYRETGEAYPAWKRASAAYLELQREHDRLTAAAGRDSAQTRALEARILTSWGAVAKLLPAAERPIEKLIEGTEAEVAVAQKEAREVAARSVAWILGVILFGAAALFGLGALLTRSIGQVVRSLTGEASKLSDAVQHGELAVRGDAQSVNVEFRGIVEGMNRTMDAFVKPIELTATYVERISNGDIPPPITEDFRGDFNSIKVNLNRCAGAVRALVSDTSALVSAAVEGKLSTRSDASLHHGEFRTIVEGVNATLDAVVGPMEEATEVLQKLSQRDLGARVCGSYQGDHARVKEALNATAQALNDALAQVADAVGQVSAASSQIASTSQSVANGASEQASALEETSSSLESMASMTKGAAASAQQATALARTASSAANDGSAAMAQMMDAMAKIKTSAAATSQIIKDINEITFQTNLLALNAAVEAARAGEAGRGFAVVAEEVRSLALRSKDAANKTEELIRQSVQEAGGGELSARQVNAKLLEIVGSISKVSDIVGEIAASAKEQSAGIDQVSTAIGEIGKVTQQNAASSEESSSAAVELEGQSQELAAMLGTFRLGRGTQRTGSNGHLETHQGKLAGGPLDGKTRTTRPATGLRAGLG